jgi:hypothetical protein
MRQTKKASTIEMMYTTNMNKTGCKAPTEEVELRLIVRILVLKGY